MFIIAELAKLVDALDSDSSVRKDFRVQVPSSALQDKIRNNDYQSSKSFGQTNA